MTAERFRVWRVRYGADGRVMYSEHRGTFADRAMAERYAELVTRRSRRIVGEVEPVAAVWNIADLDRELEAAA